MDWRIKALGVAEAVVVAVVVVVTVTVGVATVVVMAVAPLQEHADENLATGSIVPIVVHRDGA